MTIKIMDVKQGSGVLCCQAFGDHERRLAGAAARKFATEIAGAGRGCEGRRLEITRAGERVAWYCDVSGRLLSPDERC